MSLQEGYLFALSCVRCRFKHNWHNNILSFSCNSEMHKVNYKNNNCQKGRKKNLITQEYAHMVIKNKAVLPHTANSWCRAQ